MIGVILIYYSLYLLMKDSSLALIFFILGVVLCLYALQKEENYFHSSDEFGDIN